MGLIISEDEAPRYIRRLVELSKEARPGSYMSGLYATRQMKEHLEPETARARAIITNVFLKKKTIIK